MAKRGSVSQVDDMDQVGTALVQLARLALAGREQDTALFVQRTARRLRETDPAVADALVGMLRESPTRFSPLRRVGSTEIKEVPVDSDSRLAF